MRPARPTLPTRPGQTFPANLPAANVARVARYNIRDLIGHWVAPRSGAGKMCPHACCRNRRVHPDNYPVILPSKLLHRASDQDLAEHFKDVSRGSSAKDQRATAQILHEMQRRDELAERKRRHREAVVSTRAARNLEREAERERIYLAGEEFTRGNWTNRAGTRAGISDREILTGRQSVFDRYASEEAREFFRTHPRPTAAYFAGRDTRVSEKYTERRRRRHAVYRGRLAGR